MQLSRICRLSCWATVFLSSRVQASITFIIYQDNQAIAPEKPKQNMTAADLKHKLEFKFLFYFIFWGGWGVVGGGALLF